MRRDDKVDTRKTKQIARKMYYERQIKKFVDWSWNKKGKIKYADIKSLQNKYDIECYGESRRRK